MIQKLKSKKINDRRGGPNFIKRGGRKNSAASGTTGSRVAPMSPELQRFMDNMQEVPAGHNMHSPQHGTYEAIRDD